MIYHSSTTSNSNHYNNNINSSSDKLFQGLKFYFQDSFVKDKPKIIEHLASTIVENGGKKITSPLPQCIYVFETFRDEEFEKARRDGKDIIGVNYLKECIENGIRLSDKVRDHPILSMCLQKYRISMIEYESTYLEDLEYIIKILSGTCVKEFDSTVNILITRSVTSKIARQAMNLNIKIIDAKWIVDCFEQLRELNPDLYKVPIFTGCTICLTGFGSDERNRINELTKQYGGTFSGNLTQQCTHLIASETNSDKYKTAMSWQLTVVNKDWFFKSIESGFLLNESLYTNIQNSKRKLSSSRVTSSINQNDLSSSSTPVYIPTPMPRNSIITTTPPSLSPSNNPFQTTNNNQSRQLALPQPQAQQQHQNYNNQYQNNQSKQLALPQPTQNVTNSQQQALVVREDSQSLLMDTKEITIFKDKVFSTMGFDEKDDESIKEYIMPYIMAFQDSSTRPPLSQSSAINKVDYIIGQHGAKIDRDRVEFDQAELVSAHWFSECISQERILDVNEHIVYKPVKRKNILKGLFITISGVPENTKEFKNLVDLMNVLGALHVRRMKKNATKMLIIQKGGSTEMYKRALEWSIPILTKEWIYECAKTGTKVNEDGFYYSPPLLLAPSQNHDNQQQQNTVNNQQKQQSIVNQQQQQHQKQHQPPINQNNLIFSNFFIYISNNFTEKEKIMYRNYIELLGGRVITDFILPITHYVVDRIDQSTIEECTNFPLQLVYKKVTSSWIISCWNEKFVLPESNFIPIESMQDIQSISNNPNNNDNNQNNNKIEKSDDEDQIMQERNVQIEEKVETSTQANLTAQPSQTSAIRDLISAIKDIPEIKQFGFSIPTNSHHKVTTNSDVKMDQLIVPNNNNTTNNNTNHLDLYSVIDQQITGEDECSFSQQPSFLQPHNQQSNQQSNDSYVFEDENSQRITYGEGSERLKKIKLSESTKPFFGHTNSMSASFISSKDSEFKGLLHVLRDSHQSINKNNDSQNNNNNSNIKSPSSSNNNQTTSTTNNSNSKNNSNNTTNSQQPLKYLILSGFSDDDRPNDELLQPMERFGLIVQNDAVLNDLTTHLVVKLPKRSEKYLMACAAGKWALHTSYLIECNRAGKLLDEEQFEWSKELCSRLEKTSAPVAPNDWIGASKLCRLAVNRTKKPIFHGVKLCIPNSSRLEAWGKIIVAGGGEVVPPNCREITHLLMRKGESLGNFEYPKQVLPIYDTTLTECLKLGKHLVQEK